MSRYGYNKTSMTGLALAAFGGLAALILGANVFQHSDREEYNVEITGTERVTTSDGDGNVSSRYIVFTVDENGTQREFENTDSLLECFWGRCKFDSSSIHNTLNRADDADQMVHIETYGWRVPFLSMYPNIVEAELIEK